MKTLGFASACLLFVLTLSAPLHTAGFAAIRGRVTLTRTVPGGILPSSVYRSRTVGAFEPSETPEIRNVVVYLQDPPTAAAASPTAPMRAEIRQKNEAFVPSVVAVTTGSTVAFPNSDPFYHNVFSLSRSATFDLGRFPQGDSRELVLEKAGIVKVFCHLHSHMSATILVLDHPYFTVPAEDGTFVLPDVPQGRYTIVGWHERVGTRQTTVDVPASGTVSVELHLPIEEES